MDVEVSQDLFCQFLSLQEYPFCHNENMTLICTRWKSNIYTWIRRGTPSQSHQSSSHSSHAPMTEAFHSSKSWHPASS